MKLFKKTGLVSDIDDHKLEGESIGLPCVEDGNYHVDIVIIFKKSCFEEKNNLYLLNKEEKV